MTERKTVSSYVLSALTQTVGGTAKCISGQEGFVVGIAVDAYIEHHKIEEIIHSRNLTGYTLLKMIECKPKNDQDYVTMIWGFTNPEMKINPPDEVQS